MTYGEHLADHSQWGEQQIILDFFDGYVGRFLDLGAYDGIGGSNTRGLSDRHWSGVCVEASPFTFQRLVENHSGNPKIQCLCAAVLNRSGAAVFLDSDDQSSACVRHPDPTLVKRRYSVACMRPDDIASCFGSFDFVSIDLEGADLGVIEEAGAMLQGTKLVCLEDAIPYKPFDPEYYAKLVSALNGYGFTKIIGRTTDESKSGNTLIARP